jgi:transcriptional regulator with XRE-family HTH domain
MLGHMDRSELGATLRSWRERLGPTDVGLPAGVRRRTPGLRREEVCQLAGVSVDYLTRLEQGRGAHPSGAVLTALARALRLSTAERDHLFHLAGSSPPVPGRISDAVRPSVLRLMDRFTDLPAMLLNAKLDVLAWNPMAAALLRDFSSVPPGQRNIVWQRFADGPVRLAADDTERARLDRQLVADLRGAAARYPDDPGLVRLVTRLLDRSPEFAALWAQRPVGSHHDDRKRIEHPELGVLELDCDALHVPGEDQTLIVYSATEGSREAEALALLRVLGTQRWGSAETPDPSEAPDPTEVSGPAES